MKGNKQKEEKLEDEIFKKLENSGNCKFVELYAPIHL